MTEATDTRPTEARDIPILDPYDPRPTAREFRSRYFTRNGLSTIAHHRGDVLHHVGTHWAELPDIELRSPIYDFLEDAIAIRTLKNGDTKQEPFKPTKHKVTNVIDALNALTVLPSEIEAPAWIDPDPDDPNPAHIVPARNGILHVPSNKLYPHTPRFFNRHAVDFDYDPNETMPENWLRFLGQLWPDDDEAVRTLQQWIGYCLMPDTSQQKILLLVGPKRSGKGTIARVLSALIGRMNVAAPTLAGLSTNFGLSPLIGAMLAIISDARLSGRADQAVIAERLLSISGEDHITIDRKHRDPWTGKLPTRFMILTNELPRLADASGALASRFIVLTLNNSFYGHEDHGLTDRLLGELPAIFNWAIDGWRDLQNVGRFIMPASSEQAVAELEDLGSPVGAFIRERCHVGAGHRIERGRLFDAWKDWCTSEGREHPGTAASFGRDLRAAIPGLRDSRPRVGGFRMRYLEGIDLAD